MPELRFEADTHGELVTLVRRWLASAELEEDAATAVGVVEGSAAVTKDALQVIAASAPGSIAQSDLVKSLTDLGYKATDITKQLVAAVKQAEELPLPATDTMFEDVYAEMPKDKEFVNSVGMKFVRIEPGSFNMGF